MAPNPRRQRAKLNDLYDRLPAVQCKGLCVDSCGPIDMSVRERQDIEAAAGHSCRTGEDGLCNMLGDDGRCTVYDLRPMICRMWGAVESMPCMFGCVPEGGLMPDDEAYPLIAASLEAGGKGTNYQRLSEDLVRTAMQDENMRRQMIAAGRKTWDARMRERFG